MALDEEKLKICEQMIETCIVECGYASMKIESEGGKREINQAIEKLQEAKRSIQWAEEEMEREEEERH